jgi:MoaA/NifB/PqqE/SkfB family radical SAM enzyme
MNGKVNTNPPLPRILILFVTSTCNLKCEHCFYWKNLNQKNDLTFEQLVGLSDSLDTLDYVLISGGEPFLRKELVEILQLFSRQNHVQFFSIPTGAALPDLVVRRVREMLTTIEGVGIKINLSIDGLPEFHDKQRGLVGSFDRAVQTYHELAAMKSEFSRLEVNVTPTLADNNVDQVMELAQFVKENMPLIDSFNFSILRGTPKSKDLHTPHPDLARQVYNDIKSLLPNKSVSSYEQRVIDAVFETKARTLEEERQVVPCIAGESIVVVEADGVVKHCELRESIGNLKEQSFIEIWNSDRARMVKDSIRRGECHCTHECFIYPSYTQELQNNFGQRVEFYGGVAQAMRVEGWKLKEKVKGIMFEPQPR